MENKPSYRESVVQLVRTIEKGSEPSWMGLSLEFLMKGKHHVLRAGQKLELQRIHCTHESFLMSIGMARTSIL